MCPITRARCATTGKRAGSSNQAKAAADMTDIAGAAPPPAGMWGRIAAVFREGARHQPPGGWTVLIAVGAVAAALYVLWIGALSTVVGDLAGWIARDLAAMGVSSGWLETFSTWARAFSSQ